VEELYQAAGLVATGATGQDKLEALLKHLSTLRTVCSFFARNQLMAWLQAPTDVHSLNMVAGHHKPRQELDVRTLLAFC
jgi:hypothetical protein